MGPNIIGVIGKCLQHKDKHPQQSDTHCMSVLYDVNIQIKH